MQKRHSGPSDHISHDAVYLGSSFLGLVLAEHISAFASSLVTCRGRGALLHLLLRSALPLTPVTLSSSRTLTCLQGAPTESVSTHFMEITLTARFVITFLYHQLCSLLMFKLTSLSQCRFSSVLALPITSPLLLRELSKCWWEICRHLHQPLCLRCSVSLAFPGDRGLAAHCTGRTGVLPLSFL